MLSYFQSCKGTNRRFPLNGRGMPWKNNSRSIQKLTQIKISLLRMQFVECSLYLIMSSKFTALNSSRNFPSYSLIFFFLGSKIADESKSYARAKQEGKWYLQVCAYVYIVLLTKTLSLFATLITSFQLLIMSAFTSLITNQGIQSKSSSFSISDILLDIYIDLFILETSIISQPIQVKSQPLRNTNSTSLFLVLLLSVFALLFCSYKYSNAFASQELEVSLGRYLFFTLHSNQSQAFDNIIYKNYPFLLIIIKEISLSIFFQLAINKLLINNVNSSVQCAVTHFLIKSQMLWQDKDFYNYNIKHNKMKKKFERKKTVAEFQIYLDRKLGGGAFGAVYQSLNKNTQELVAMKMIERKKIHDQNQKYMINALKRQALILSKISSQHVVAFKEILATKSYYYIAQELCDGDLKQYLAKNPKVPEKKALQFMSMLLKGFYAMVVINVIHRDIKPANILFKDNDLKIADFGFSRKVGGGQMMTSVVGTSAYCSPQIINKERYTSKTDIWSLGVLFYQMLYSKLPFMVSNIKKLKEACDDFDFPNKPQVSEQTQQIIRKCLQFDEKDRADWQYLFEHPYFKDHVPSLKNVNMKLNYIVSAIRQEIDENNIDLQKFFKKYGFQKDKQINYKQYEQLIMKLIPMDKLTKNEILFSFNMFDEDKNEKISFNELKKILQGHGIQMNAVTSSQICKYFVTNTKNQDEQGNIVPNQENFSPEEQMLYVNTQNAYKKLIYGLGQKKFEDLYQMFELEILTSQGLSLQEFTSFVHNNLKQDLTQSQCQLIFNKLDDDKNGVLGGEQFYKYVCKQINIPTMISYIEKQEKK